MNKKLRKAVKKAGGQAKLALVFGVSRQFVSQLALKHRPIPKSFDEKLDNYLTVK